MTAQELRKRILALRDAVIVKNMNEHRGHSRELSLCLTRLDEAAHWATEYGVKAGSHMIVPRDEVLALADAMETT